MSRRSLVVVASLVVVVIVALGCVTEQDLGSHGVLPEAGAPDAPFPAFDGSIVFPVDAGQAEKLVFITEGLYSGDLAAEGRAPTGLQGGDALCNTEARDAGLGGSFKAWLSTASENAKDRIAPVGPWRMVRGTPFLFPAKASGGTPQGFLQYTAKGDDLFFSNQSDVWTGTKETGTANVATCAGWTSALGTATGNYGQFTWTSGYWTDYRGVDSASQSKPCSTRLRLYCFEQ